MFWQNYLRVLLLNCEQNPCRVTISNETWQNVTFAENQSFLGILQKEIWISQWIFSLANFRSERVERAALQESYEPQFFGNCFQLVHMISIGQKIQWKYAWCWCRNQFNCLQIALTPLAWSVLTTCLYNCSIDSGLPRE